MTWAQVLKGEERDEGAVDALREASARSRGRLRARVDEIPSVGRVLPDDTRLEAFEAAHPEQQWCVGLNAHGQVVCNHCEEGWQRASAVAATLSSGEIVGAARLPTCQSQARHCHLALTVSGSFERTDLPEQLLRQAGYQRLYACLTYRHQDALRSCRSASLRVESAFPIGSVTEVVLGVGQG